MKSWLKRAREAAGMSPAECARILDAPEEAFLIREESPGMLTLNELRALRAAFNDDARRILWEAVCEFRP